jgi:hypothetical protein
VQDIVSLVYTGRGVNNATSSVTRVEANGSFKTEAIIALDPGTARIHFQVALELKSGSRVTAEAVFQRLDFECFLKFVDEYEGKRPIGRVDGKCQVAGGHFEFLSSVRKMFQPPPKSPLTGMFNLFLNRNHKICQLVDPDSAQGKYIRTFENLPIGDEVVDVGHVLVGIEASRKQKPDSIYPSAVERAANTEALLTWAGDLGSALEAYAEAVLNHNPASLPDYLTRLAGRADLLGDIDGLNLGAIYDETKTLAENFRTYYSVRQLRRFHDVLSNAIDDSGNPLFRLVRQKPPELDNRTRQQIAGSVSLFATAAATLRMQRGKLNGAQAKQVFDMCTPGTKEMDVVVDYFVNFLLAGLAKES